MRACPLLSVTSYRRLQSKRTWVCVQGFLPESADRFATDVIYPAFSPQMGVFFVCSTAYGVWKVCPCTLFCFHNLQLVASSQGLQLIALQRCRRGQGRTDVGVERARWRDTIEQPWCRNSFWSVSCAVPRLPAVREHETNAWCTGCVVHVSMYKVALHWCVALYLHQLLGRQEAC